MRGQRWVIGAVLAIALANTGCVACCHKGYQKALEHAPDCELSTPCRNEMYVFLIDGVIWVVAWSAQPDDFDAAMPGFDEATESVHLTGP